MNIFTFTGNIGRDAESRNLQNGTAVCSFPVAVSSGYGDNKKTTWVRCALFGKRAEGGLVQYLKKGAQVAISGELSLNEFDGQDGHKRASLDLRVNEIDLVGGKQSGDKSSQSPQPANSNSGPDYGGGEDYSDDIPFAQHMRGTII